MQPTSNLQQQPSSAIQQPRSGLQDGDSSLSTQNFTQDQLVAPELHVGNATVGQQSRVEPATQVSSHHGISPLWLLIPLVIALVVLWPRKQEPIIEIPEPEQPEVPITVKKQPKRPKSRPTKHKRAKR